MRRPRARSIGNSILGTAQTDEMARDGRIDRGGRRNRPNRTYPDRWSASQLERPQMAERRYEDGAGKIKYEPPFYYVTLKRKCPPGHIELLWPGT